MADATLVYSPIKNIHTTSIAFTSTPKPISKSPGRKTSSCKNQVPKVRGVENYRKSLEVERISISTAKLISIPRQLASVAGYGSAWNKWVRWCCRQQIDPVCAPLSEILNYLSTLFEKWSTISSYKFKSLCYFSIPRLCRWKSYWKHPRACALLTGVFNQRPPLPRYTFVWDAEIVLVYLKTNMSDNSQLSDKDLTHKLTVLMTLSSASRTSSLQHLNIKFMAKNDMS